MKSKTKWCLFFAEIDSNILYASHSNNENAQCHLDSVPSRSKSALKANEKTAKSRSFHLIFCLLFTNYVFFSFVIHYTAIFYLKSSNFLIFGNEESHSDSRELKTLSIGIAYTESKPFRSECVTCLYITIDLYWCWKGIKTFNLFNRIVEWNFNVANTNKYGRRLFAVTYPDLCCMLQIHAHILTNICSLAKQNRTNSASTLIQTFIHTHSLEQWQKSASSIYFGQNEN